MCLYFFLYVYMDIKCQATEGLEAEEGTRLERELKSLFGDSKVLQLWKELGDFLSKSSGDVFFPNALRRVLV